MPKKEDLTGKTFNLIKCISPAPSKSGKTYWNCQCIVCGTKKVIQTSHIKDNSIKSCGCGCLRKKEEEKEEKCEICGNKFFTTSSTRKYCYDCSPAYKDRTERAKSISILRQAMKKQAIKIKGGKCKKCGYNKCIAALTFHHTNPKEKSFGLSDGNLHSWKDYLNEAMKCDLLCANCHMEEHWLKNDGSSSNW